MTVDRMLKLIERKQDEQERRSRKASGDGYWIAMGGWAAIYELRCEILEEIREEREQ